MRSGREVLTGGTISSSVASSAGSYHLQEAIHGLTYYAYWSQLGAELHTTPFEGTLVYAHR